MVSSRVLVVFHSDNGSVRELATAVEAGARQAGALTRLRSLGDVLDGAEEGFVDDVLWADVIAVGTPCHFGSASAPVQRVLERCLVAAESGALANKVVTAFTTGSSVNGGQESVLLGVYDSVASWGAVVLPTGCTAPAFRAVGGNPYGLSVTTGRNGPVDRDAATTAGRALGHRAAEMADRLLGSRSPDSVE